MVCGVFLVDGDPHGDRRPPFPPQGFGKGLGAMGSGMGRESVLVILSEHPEYWTKEKHQPFENVQNYT